MSMVTIAIDGPAAAGKSTCSKMLAKRLGLMLVDTGALYRSIALQAQRTGVPIDAEDALAELAQALDVRFSFDGTTNRTILCGEDVSHLIRTPEISASASHISAWPKVRSGLMDLQRQLASRPPGAVLEGRDIGTVVLPGATAKFFLTASIEVRARRRYDELVARQGVASVEFAAVLASEEERDRRDSTRSVAPLVQAPDAVLLDTSVLSLEEVVERMISAVQ